MRKRRGGCGRKLPPPGSRTPTPPGGLVRRHGGRRAGGGWFAPPGHRGAAASAHGGNEPVVPSPSPRPHAPAMWRFPLRRREAGKANSPGSGAKNSLFPFLSHIYKKNPKHHVFLWGSPSCSNKYSTKHTAQLRSFQYADTAAWAGEAAGTTTRAGAVPEPCRARGHGSVFCPAQEMQTNKLNCNKYTEFRREGVGASLEKPHPAPPLLHLYLMANKY